MTPPSSICELDPPSVATGALSLPEKELHAINALAITLEQPTTRTTLIRPWYARASARCVGKNVATALTTAHVACTKKQRAGEVLEDILVRRTFGRETE